jgi:membrane protease YdiL (CAAX protease family)
VPWGLWEATEVFTVLVFLMVLVSVGISALPWMRGTARPAGLLPAVALVAAYCLYMGLAVLMAWRRAGAGLRPWRLLGLRRLPLGSTVRPALRTYALLLFLLTPAALYAAHHYLAVSNVFFRGAESPGAYVLYFVLVCLLAPVAEEILFRGFIYAGLRRLFSPGWAALVSALAFTGAHLPAPSVAALVVIALGFALALLYENTRSLLPCILVHALHNTLVFVAMLAVMAL